ncbi:MAG: class D sortase [Terracidiphilus sp.]|jgi:sortase A
MTNTRQTDQPEASANRKRRFRIKLVTLLVWCETILLLAGSVLFAWFVTARVDSYLSSRAALKAFEDPDKASVVSRDSIPAGEGSEENQVPEPDFSDWTRQRILAYEMDAANAKDATLAVLEIPKIHLVAPVLEGTDGPTLNHAVGRIAGTSLPGEHGNIGLAAHRDSFFRGMKDLKPGDAIELRTHGRSDTYTVDHVEIVTPREVRVLAPQARPALTLVTCYPFYFVGSAPQRFVVTADLERSQNTRAQGSSVKGGVFSGKTPLGIHASRYSNSGTAVTHPAPAAATALQDQPESQTPKYQSEEP